MPYSKIITGAVYNCSDF